MFSGLSLTFLISYIHLYYKKSVNVVFVLQVITPPPQYDEPYFVVTHEYNKFPIRDTSENTEGESFGDSIATNETAK